MGVSRTQAVLWGVVGASLVFVLGAYGGSIAGGERGSFTMNFPAEGKECGGPNPRELTGSIAVPVDSAGAIKRAVQPHVVEVASHVVRNVGETPRYISFVTSGFPEGTEYHSRDKAWNERTHAIEREISPGEAVDFGLLVRLPDPLPAKPVLVDGLIAVVDTESGERISELPVRIVRSGAAAVAGECCE